MRTGALGARVGGVDGPPEVRLLAARFDDMATRLEELVLSQEAFVADASHQLRNPLVGLRLRIENLAAGGQADLPGLSAEVGRLSRVVDGLLTLARADREASDRGSCEIAATTLLQDRCAEWEALARRFLR